MLLKVIYTDTTGSGSVTDTTGAASSVTGPTGPTGPTDPTDTTGAASSVKGSTGSASYVTDVTIESGSEIVKFSSYDTIIDTFTAIPGQLDTELLEEGDYSDSSILSIFKNLKKYSYSESIFDIIKYNLAAFFPSIAYVQAYTTIVEELTAKMLKGEITLVEYNIALKVAAKELSDKYPIWYFKSLTKIELAMIKYRYILE